MARSQEGRRMVRMGGHVPTYKHLREVMLLWTLQRGQALGYHHSRCCGYFKVYWFGLPRVRLHMYSKSCSTGVLGNARTGINDGAYIPYMCRMY